MTSALLDDFLLDEACLDDPGGLFLAALAATILEAIRREYLANWALQQALPGGFWTGQARGLQVASGQPFLRVAEIGGMAGLNTGRAVFYSVNSYQFSAIARSSSEAKALGDLVRDFYSNRDFASAEGTTSGGLQYRGDERIVPDRPGPKGHPRWRSEWTFGLFVNRVANG